MRANYKRIETLRGLSLDERVEFSKNDSEHYIRVKLYDKGNRCAWCKNPIKTIQDATLDHIVPRSLGGRTRESNLQLMHRRCNSKKSSTLTYFSSDMLKAFISMRKNTPRGDTGSMRGNT